MSESGNMMPFGDVSKAAIVLMEKISDSVTGLCRPWQVKRVATAEAEAKLIASKADIECLELEERALHRFAAEETAKQHNMESIAAKAIPHLNQEADPSKMEKDWVTYFMDRCRLISDDEMQQMWSRLLADEANSPGSISKQTVNIIAQMSKNDALMFQKFASFVLIRHRPTPIILPNIVSSTYWNDYDFTSMTKWDLQSLGLVDVCQSAGGFFLEDVNAGDRFTYFDETICLTSVDSSVKDSLPFGSVDFTRSGAELFRICKPAKIDGFCNDVINYWDSEGVKCLVQSISS